MFTSKLPNLANAKNETSYTRFNMPDQKTANDLTEAQRQLVMNCIWLKTLLLRSVRRKKQQ